MTAAVKWIYEGTVKLTDEQTIGSVRTIEDFLTGVGEIFDRSRKPYTIEFRVEADNPWDLRGVVEEVVQMLLSECIHFSVSDDGAWGEQPVS